MDNITYTLQEFLDGNLGGEEEAELLHRLSVSPERRDLLRSFMKQQQIINADRAAIAVPYSAEQKLWTTLAEMPPFTAPVAESASSVATTGTLLSSAFMKIAATAVVAISLGFVSGYFFGERNSNEIITTKTSVTSAPQNSSIASVPFTSEHTITNHSGSATRSSSYHMNRSTTVDATHAFSEAPLVTDQAAPTDNRQTPAPVIIDAERITENVPVAPMIIPAAAMIREPNGAQVNRPRFWNSDEKPARRDASILDRLEFSTHVGIGKQFPNSAATNISMPYFTNSDVTVKYMILPELWIGTGFGYANMNQKQLKVSLVHPNDPSSGEQVDFDYVHEKTAWIGGVMEYRIPVSGRTSFAINGGIAASSLGAIYSSEFGARFEVTDHVGVLSGVRVTQSTSNASKQLADIRNSGTTKLGIVSGADQDNKNYNLELSTGIYFRF